PGSAATAGNWVFGLTRAESGSRIPRPCPRGGPIEPPGRERVELMVSGLKNDELVSYRQVLQTLRSRLRGDLDQMTDEALRRDMAGGTGNLSNAPLHLADLGT